MISNFKRFETRCPELYKKIISLEKRIEQRDFDFDLNLRKILELTLKTEPLKSFLIGSEDGDFHHRLKWIFDLKNRQSIEKILDIDTKKFHILKKDFFHLKEQLNPYAHEFKNSKKDRRINLLSIYHEILNVIYLSSNTLDFKTSFYYSKDFFKNEKLRRAFENYEVDVSEETIPERLLVFLLKEVIHITSEIDISEIESQNTTNFIVEDDFIDVCFFDEISKDLIKLKAILNRNYYYGLEQFSEDIERLKNHEYLSFDFNEEIVTNFYIFSPNFHEHLKKEVGENSLLYEKEGIKIRILDESEIFRRYGHKNENGIPKGDFVLELKDKNHYFLMENENYKMIIANVLASSIYNAWNASNGGVLKKNVRGYIRNKKIDLDIETTMIESPEKFPLYNNGLTAFARNSDKEEWLVNKRYLNFDEFYIVNGGQTTRLIARIFDKGLLLDEEKKLSVLMKIIIPNENLEVALPMINKVAETSNQQKPIKPQDLWGNDPQLTNWESSFNSKWFSPYLFSLKRETHDSRDLNIKIVDLPCLLQLAQATLEMDPFVAKNSKSLIFSKLDIIRKIFDRLDLNSQGIQYFLFDLLTLNSELDSYVSIMKKMSNIDDTERSVKVTILKTGKYFLIFLIYVFHLIKKLDIHQKHQLLNALKSDDLTNQDKSEIFKQLSSQTPLGPLFVRSELPVEGLSNFKKDTMMNLQHTIFEILEYLFEKDRSVIEGKNNISSDWLKIFKQFERGWTLAKPIIEKFIKRELYSKDDKFFPQAFNSLPIV